MAEPLTKAALATMFPSFTQPQQLPACPGCENYYASRRQRFCPACRRRHKAAQRAAYIQRALARADLVRRPGIAPMGGRKPPDSGMPADGINTNPPPESEASPD